MLIAQNVFPSAEVQKAWHQSAENSDPVAAHSSFEAEESLRHQTITRNSQNRAAIAETRTGSGNFIRPHTILGKEIEFTFERDVAVEIETCSDTCAGIGGLIQIVAQAEGSILRADLDLRCF